MLLLYCFVYSLCIVVGYYFGLINWFECEVLGWHEVCWFGLVGVVDLVVVDIVL